MCLDKCCKKNKFYDFFINNITNNENISRRNLSVIKLKYIDVMRELDRLKKTKKIQYYIITVIYYILFGILSVIPLIGQLTIDTEDNIYTSISSLILLFFIQPFYIIITHKLNYTNRKFVYNKTHLNLRNEGMKLLNWKRHKRYHIYRDINGAVDIFMKKISSIIQDNVFRVIPLTISDDSDDYDSRIQIANHFMSSDIITRSLI